MKTLIHKLQSLLNRAVETDLECGCQLAIYEHGKLIADLCAGHTAPDRKTEIKPDTLFPVFSAGKPVAATAVHRLVEKGVLSYSTRIGDIWQEFDCNGKERILLWHILTHREALFDLPEYHSIDELTDWDLMCKRIAAMTPAWEPGTLCRYHPITYAWLLGEPAARADGRAFSQIVQDEVVAPLKLEREIFFGIDAEGETRIAHIDCSKVGADNELILWMNSQAVRRACLPAFNGLASARALAKFYAALTDEVDQTRLLLPETLSNASITRRASYDPIDPNDIWPRFGLGFVTYGFENDLTRVIGHGGAIGSEGYLDRKRHLAVAFTKNRVSAQHPNHLLRDQISEVLELPNRHW
ncbi:MAG: beta-lactamase family protein [Victivallales bacterium]|jgi:CubicO group peptidase (beta-lactamase class C family)|nr:beta-lactamase family protein [Victivallales bacterium]